MNHTLLLVLLLAVLIAINVPVAVALGASAVAVGLLIQGDLGFVGTVLFSSLQKIELLAIPFFILAGNVFNQCGIIDRLFALVDALVGQIRGKTAMVTTGVSVLLGGLSGSGPADTAALGSTLGPVMKARNYSPGFIGALISSSGALGLVVPPSIAFILYGVAVPGISIGTMFVAGILPGLMMAALIAAWAYFESVRRNFDTIDDAPASVPVLRVFVNSIFGLLAPVVIVGGIYLGVFTPTEAAGVAVIYGLLVGMFIYREIGFNDLPGIARTTVIDTAVVMFIVACASLFSWVVTIDGTVVRWVMDFAGSASAQWQVFLLAGVVLLVAGLFIDGASIYLVLVPLLIPAVRAMQIDLVWFGVFVAAAVAIGQFTPPVGVNLFVAARVLRIPVDVILREVLPFIAVAMLVLVLLYLFPAISLWLPSTMPG